MCQLRLCFSSRACYLPGCWRVCIVQRYKIVSATVEPADEDCDWPSDPEDSLPVSSVRPFNFIPLKVGNFTCGIILANSNHTFGSGRLSKLVHILDISGQGSIFISIGFEHCWVN